MSDVFFTSINKLLFSVLLYKRRKSDIINLNVRFYTRISKEEINK